jgi:hypothetical protein
VVEDDTDLLAFGGPDSFEYIYENANIPCGKMHEMFSKGEFGLVDQTSRDGLLLVDKDGDVKGAFSYTLKVTLLLR